MILKKKKLKTSRRTTTVKDVETTSNLITLPKTRSPNFRCEMAIGWVDRCNWRDQSFKNGTFTLTVIKRNIKSPNNTPRSLNYMYVFETLDVHYIYVIDTLSTHEMYVLGVLTIHCLYELDTLKVRYMCVLCTLDIHYMYVFDTLSRHPMCMFETLDI